jgi:ABC-type sugar transport system ATPase subunit
MFPSITTLVPTANIEQQIFIRPSQLILEKTAAAGLQGKVTNVSFMGNHYMVAIQLDGLVLQVASFEPGITVGENYTVSLRKNAIYHML